jgi:ATP-dependent protease ClpP protease subunit
MLHLTDRLMRILAEHTSQEFEKVKKDADRDYFMSAEEAKAYGVIDAVFEPTGESLISMKQAAGGTVPTAKEAAAAEAKIKK